MKFRSILRKGETDVFVCKTEKAAIKAVEYFAKEGNEWRDERSIRWERHGSDPLDYKDYLISLDEGTNMTFYVIRRCNVCPL